MINFYIGTTGSGKSTRALTDLGTVIEENRNPGLIINSQGVTTFSSVTHYDTWKEAAKVVWSDKKRKNAAFIPSGPKDVEYIFHLARTLKNINIILDEAAFWVSARHVPKPIELAFRTHLHTGVVILGTSQHASDLSPLVYQTLSSLYVFRCTSPRILDRLQKEFDIDREKIKNLSVGECIKLGGGF